MKNNGNLRILLNHHHIHILRFLMNNKNKQKEFNLNEIAVDIGAQQTKTKEWISHLDRYGLIILEETNKKPKRYKVILINDKIPLMETILNTFERFSK